MPTGTAAPPTATATPPPTVTPPPTATQTPQPTATAPPPIEIPLAQASLPVPNSGNGALDSPLADALSTAEQPMSFSVPASWTLPLEPATTTVYAVTPVSATWSDMPVIAHELGVPAGPLAVNGLGNTFQATVRVDSNPYTLTVYDGYGAAWFSLDAIRPHTGALSTARLPGYATAWLAARSLARGDLYTMNVGNSSIDYGQEFAGTALAGHVAVHMRFDGAGVLRSLRYEYIQGAAAISAPLEQPNLAAQGAIEQGLGFYHGPPVGAANGPAALAQMGMTLAGVRGSKVDYLEPVYVLNGAIPTTTGAQPFTLFTAALQYVQTTPATPTP